MSDNNGKIYLNIQALLARSPRRSRGIRVASGFEFSVCVSVCLSAYLFVLCKFSNFFLQYKAAAVRAVISISYGSKEGVQGSLFVHQYIVP